MKNQLGQNPIRAPAKNFFLLLPGVPPEGEGGLFLLSTIIVFYLVTLHLYWYPFELIHCYTFQLK
jgi:hypothetical protein